MAKFKVIFQDYGAKHGKYRYGLFGVVPENREFAVVEVEAESMDEARLKAEECLEESTPEIE